MSIFNLLLDNIFFVVVIVGFIFSLLSKMRGKPQDAERQTAGMPSFDGKSSVNGQRNNQRTARQPIFETRRNMDQQSMRTVIRPEPRIDPISIKVEDGVYAFGQGNSIEDDLIGRGNIAASALKVNDDAQVKAREIVQGIIWSEILSPPRAKRPYRR